MADTSFWVSLLQGFGVCLCLFLSFLSLLSTVSVPKAGEWGVSKIWDDSVFTPAVPRRCLL